jgi:hypothetical protein
MFELSESRKSGCKTTISIIEIVGPSTSACAISSIAPLGLKRRRRLGRVAGSREITPTTCLPHQTSLNSITEIARLLQQGLNRQLGRILHNKRHHPVPSIFAYRVCTFFFDQMKLSSSYVTHRFYPLRGDSKRYQSISGLFLSPT